MWTAFILVAVLWMLYATYRFTKSTERYKDSFGLGMCAFLLIVGLIVPPIITTAIAYDSQSQATSSTLLVEMKEQQRDELVALVREELSSKQYAELMAATPKADLLVILGSSASNIMVNRAQQIVELNQKVNDLKNSIAQKRIDVCKWVQNPMIPKFWFVGPKCHLR